ncbi:hypothetical protein FB451DRAFT_134894 [Mycena latifolia]|nr:hypothetical protein FB451DRAFT_134894 [Mycena latifolia]
MHSHSAPSSRGLQLIQESRINPYRATGIRLRHLRFSSAASSSQTRRNSSSVLRVASKRTSSFQRQNTRHHPITTGTWFQNRSIPSHSNPESSLTQCQKKPPNWSSSFNRILTRHRPAVTWFENRRLPRLGGIRALLFSLKRLGGHHCSNGKTFGTIQLQPGLGSRIEAYRATRIQNPASHSIPKKPRNWSSSFNRILTRHRPAVT